MLQFSLIWSNTNLVFHVPKQQSDFCKDFIAIMSPQDICKLFDCTYFDAEDEDALERILTFLRKKFPDFSFPNPDRISIRIKGF